MAGTIHIPGSSPWTGPFRAYRAPSDGEVRDEDDGALAGTDLASKFYAHLVKLSDVGQFIVIENDTPSSKLPEAVRTLGYDGGRGPFSWDWAEPPPRERAKRARGVWTRALRFVTALRPPGSRRG